jgi:lariat debranching enzyme
VKPVAVVLQSDQVKMVRVAVHGCCHNELDVIYNNIKKESVDLLLICGDIQCIRNTRDLDSMSVPDKYKSLGSFHEYYSGKKKAPVLTLIIGGNHEASSYMMELPYGGWVCENVYYLGYAGVVWFNGLRICGISGIYKYNDFNYAHFERLPLSESQKRSVYHVRKCDLDRLLLLTDSFDVIFSHDWPKDVAKHGNLQALLKVKPFLKKEIESGTLGNPFTKQIMTKLRPNFWFAAHMHVFYEATVIHDSYSSGSKDNQSESIPSLKRKHEDPDNFTKFMALDKIIHGRKSTHVMEITPSTTNSAMKQGTLYYDNQWLAILKETDSFYSWDKRPLSITLRNELKFSSNEFIEIPLNFRQTAPSYPSKSNDVYNNPQTREVCEMLGIRVPHDVIYKVERDPNEIEISFEDESDE